MSKLICELLGSNRRSFADMILRLEHVTLQQGVDVRLTAEIITQTREKIRRLGLDPADTTTEEFYYGLLAKAGQDSEALSKTLGVTPETPSWKGVGIIASTAEKLLKNDKVVCLQPSSVKKILKSVPPKKTMKALSFRSVDSVLKREDPLALYALAKRVEDATWQKQINARLKRLQTRDVAECPVRIITFPKKWLDKLTNQDYDQAILPVPELGAVVVFPSVPMHIEGSVLLSMAIVLQAGQRLSVEALPYRAQSMSVGMEKLLPEIAAGSMNNLDKIYGLQPTWQAVYQLLSEHSMQRVADVELVLGDLQWQTTEMRLASQYPELDYWVDTHYLGVDHQPLPVSLHLIDVTAALVLNRSFGEQVVSHMRGSLWNELQVRYLQHESLERAVLSQLSFTQEVVL